MLIDTSFDFRTDASGGDPDETSPTLRRYHKLLWSKPLPSGHLFYLDDSVRGVYLHHRSELGEFLLSSDSVMQTFTGWTRPSVRYISELLTEEENEAFDTIGYTIGGMMVFPKNRIDGKLNINGARGFTQKIADRFDLTLECIRRQYMRQRNPLADTLARYRDFFALFEDFRGYVEFFMLQDLVTADCSAVRFFTPFDDFKTPSVPKDVDTYKEFRRLSIEFIKARNRRIGLYDAADCPFTHEEIVVASKRQSDLGHKDNVDPYSDPKSIATVEEFKAALLTARISDTGLTMLKLQYGAPQHTISPVQLAEKLGYDSYATVNAQYGALAHRVADGLHYRPGPFPDGNKHWWCTLSYWNCDAGEGQDQWIMRPELAQALQALKWV